MLVDRSHPNYPENKSASSVATFYPNPPRSGMSKATVRKFKNIGAEGRRKAKGAFGKSK